MLLCTTADEVSPRIPSIFFVRTVSDQGTLEINKSSEKLGQMATRVLSATVRNSSNIEGNHDVRSVTVEESGDAVERIEEPNHWPKSNHNHQISAGNGQQKKAHRRKSSKKKRKWKPYSKMSWEERKAVEEKEKLKVVRIREEMKEKGRPVAPYNTTQFLMEEHDPYNGDLEAAGCSNSNVPSTGTDEAESYSDDLDQDEMNGNMVSNRGEDGIEDTMEEYTDSPHMVPEFISQDFSETYERVHEESLNTMSKEELLSEHMDLEKRFNQLQEQLSKTKRSNSSVVNALEAQIEQLQSEKGCLKDEVKRLLDENEALLAGKSESKMSTSDAEEEPETNSGQMSTLIDGEVMERR